VRRTAPHRIVAVLERRWSIEAVKIRLRRSGYFKRVIFPNNIFNYHTRVTLEILET
jgi:hypothetical protein